MPQTKLQKLLFAFMTVVITVHAYVFYSLYVINGSAFMANVPGARDVLDAIRQMGGVSMFGTGMPIWAVILIEFCLAYGLEITLGSPCSFKLACGCFSPQETHPVIFETAIISATVGIMCPVMSFLAAIMYYPYAYQPFHLLTLVANWLKLMCFNFPFAWFTQVFFIQPFVRSVFRLLFGRGKNRAQARTA